MPPASIPNKGNFGIIQAHACLGEKLSHPKKAHVYISHDGGSTWKYIIKERQLMSVADYGRQVMTYNAVVFRPTKTVLFSHDYGDSFQEIEFDEEMNVDGVLTEPGSHTSQFTIFGHKNVTATKDALKSL